MVEEVELLLRELRLGIGSALIVRHSAVGPHGPSPEVTGLQMNEQVQPAAVIKGVEEGPTLVREVPIICPQTGVELAASIHEDPLLAPRAGTRKIEHNGLSGNWYPCFSKGVPGGCLEALLT
jgi:hypothetical protein